MPASDFAQLIRNGDVDAFETLCLERLDSGRLRLADLVAPFERILESGKTERLGLLAQMVLENCDPQADPQAALKIARIALLADADNADLRRACAEQYRRIHGQTPGFEKLLESCGLLSGRPIRNALHLLDLILDLKPGDGLASRSEELIAQVIEVDHERGLYTLRLGGRQTTIPAAELAREYDRVDPDDLRVLRQLKPERLSELIQNDPVALVIGSIQAHGGVLDADVLKQELVPAYLAKKDWSHWWTKARDKLKRSPHVIVEGRSPMLLRYSAAGRTLEDETWEAIESKSDPAHWHGMLEGYLREKRAHKEPPDNAFLGRCITHIVSHLGSIGSRRPAEALACALVAERVAARAKLPGERAEALAVEMLRRADDPAALIAGLREEALWKLACAALETARPDDYAIPMIELMPSAPAALLDRIVAAAAAADLLDVVQPHIQRALSDPIHNAETLYWLWKGPEHADALTLPSDQELFGRILDALIALGRTVTPGAEVTKRFRQRMRAALGLKDYARARRCFEQTDAARAVTVRRLLGRVEGIGENARRRLLGMLREVHPFLWEVQTRPKLEPWENSDVLWTTEAGMQRKTAERDELVNVQMRENARRIGEAAARGDLSENSEYRFALEERDLLRARLAKINQDLSRARVLEAHQVPSDHVGVGSRVALRDVQAGTVWTLTFLGPFEADVDSGIYNYLAPVSQQLMGLRVGERTKLTLDGNEVAFEVVEIHNGLTDD